MATFDRGLEPKFVEALNEQYERKGAGWWSQFVDDEELFLAIRSNAVHVYYRGCRLIEVKWNGQLAANTHYKYLLQSTMKPEYVDVDVVDGKPSFADASRYFADGLSATELKRSARRYVGDEKKGVHGILQNNPHILDVEVAISDGESAPRVDFAALQRDEAGKIHIVFYEAKHFDNPELRSHGRPKVVDQIGEYRELIERYRPDIEKSYRRVSKNLCALNGVSERHPDRHKLLSETSHFVIDEEPGLVVFGYDGDQKSGSVWRKHEKNLRKNLNREPILLGNPAHLKIPA